MIVQDFEPSINAMPRYGSPLHFRLTLKKLFFVLIANTLIALFLFLVHSGSSFVPSFIYSQCIGLSITFCVTSAINLNKNNRLILQIGLITAAVIAGTILGIIISYFAEGLVIKGNLPSLPQTVSLKAYMFTLLYSGLFGAVISYVFISLQKLSDDKIKRLEIEKNAVATEFKLLQSQMEPHFLFNTLANVISLIDANPQKASRMLESLTALLRISFVTAREKTIPLHQEMDIIKKYLEIFSVRMGDRLQYTVDLPDKLRDFQVPPLLIQPLVENAVIHGLEPSIHGGEISVRAHQEKNGVRITVVDSGKGISEKQTGKGIGLDNIKNRLLLLYGERGRLFLEENNPIGVKAAIEIPYETSNSNFSGR